MGDGCDGRNITFLPRQGHAGQGHAAPTGAFASGVADGRMKRGVAARDLLLAGAGSRLAIAGAVILCLWLGFFWATGLPVPLVSG